MLVPLIGSENRERVPIFLLTRNEGYAREIAQFIDTNLYTLQRQLDKLEAGGVLVSRTVWRTAGRLAVLTPGHNLEVWLHPSFKALLLNCLRWCSKLF